jgi:hypothetical protein
MSATKTITLDEDEIDFVLWGLRTLMPELTKCGDFGDNDAGLVPEVEALHAKIEKHPADTVTP